jgi:chemotaxis-related protein WspD
MREIITDCWNKIGVRGDSSCKELEQAIHCRNCRVYSKAAANLLDGEPPADYIAHWTEQARRPKGLAERATDEECGSHRALFRRSREGRA